MTTEFYKNNLAIISMRWPELAQAIEQHDISTLPFEVVENQSISLSVDGIQLSSTYDPIEEALAYRKTTSGDVYHIWGFGIGNVPEVILHDQAVKEISIYIYNLDVLKLVLTLMPKPWLADKKIKLIYMHQNMDKLSDYLTRIFVSGTIIINADKFISKKNNPELHWLVHRLEHRLFIMHVNRKQSLRDDEYLSIEQENMPILKKLKPFENYLKKNRIKEAICIGAGPSLDAHIDELKEIYKQKNRPTFIAPTTACNALLKHDIIPDLMMIIDVDIPAKSIPFAKLGNTPLIFASRVKKEIISQWQGEKYYANLVEEGYNRLQQQLPTAYRLFCFGSVIHSITHVALLAGADKVSFIGCDFGFPGGVQHASTDDSNAAIVNDIDMSELVENGYGEMILSSPTYRMFCSGIETIITGCPNVEFYNMSRLGAKIIGTKYLDEAK